MTNDITKHPLYRPHHGDMTGYLMLTDEPLMRGDQAHGATPYMQPYDWTVCGSHCYGEKADTFGTLVFRRRIALTSADQPRFVTVVIPAHKHDLESLAKSFGAVDIREGNALSVLDGLEDRVEKKVREAFTGGGK